MQTNLERSTPNALQCMEIWGSNRAADTSVSTPGLDLWVYSRPHQQVDTGGDVHYVSLCGGGITTRLLLADVSGHGTSVADMARSLRDLMRRNINRKNQVRMVKEINRQFTEHAKSRRFATVIVATYLTTGKTLTICNAGHPRPFWFQSVTGQWSILASPDGNDVDGLTNLPLGIDEGVSFTQARIVLGRGDLVLFYTDALTEATAPDGRQLGEAGLLALVQSLEATNPAKVAGTLRQRVDEYCGSKAPDDDMTFLLLHHNAQKSPRLTLGQKLDVYAKVFGLKRV